jgi:hypothetical protein
MWANFAVSCPDRGPHAQPDDPGGCGLLDYAWAAINPRSLRDIPEIRVPVGPSHIWILVCIVHVWISVCGRGGRIDGPREGSRGAPTARVGTVGIGSGPVVTSCIKKPREEDSLSRRDRAPRWSSAAGSAGNAPNRTCSSQVFHVKHWDIALEVQLRASCIGTPRTSPIKSVRVVTAGIWTTGMDGSLWTAHRGGEVEVSEGALVL